MKKGELRARQDGKGGREERQRNATSPQRTTLRAGGGLKKKEPKAEKREFVLDMTNRRQSCAKNRKRRHFRKPWEGNGGGTITGRFHPKFREGANTRHADQALDTTQGNIGENQKEKGERG